MNFYVGQKVVRVTDTDAITIEGQMIKGSVYVVRWVGKYHFDVGILSAVRLIGVVKVGNVTGEIDCPYGSQNFRALEELRSESRERYYREHPEHQSA